MKGHEFCLNKLLDYPHAVNLRATLSFAKMKKADNAVHILGTCSRGQARVPGDEKPYRSRQNSNE